jgi:hypothetical protein
LLKKPKTRILTGSLEVAETVIPFIEENKNIRTKCFWKEWLNLIEIIMFRVAWIDDGNSR